MLPEFPENGIFVLAKGYYHNGKIPLSVLRALVTLKAVWSGESWRMGSLNTMLRALVRHRTSVLSEENQPVECAFHRDLLVVWT